MDILDSFIVRRNINCISKEGMQLMFQNVPESVKDYARKLRDEHQWKYYAADHVRGHAFGKSRIIVIPMWAIKKDIGYKTYYIAHELAHGFAGVHNQHNQVFMEWFKKICPPELWHHEIDYKPRNAAAAGIRKPGDVDPFDLL